MQLLRGPFYKASNASISCNPSQQRVSNSCDIRPILSRIGVFLQNDVREAYFRANNDKHFCSLKISRTVGGAYLLKSTDLSAVKRSV